MVFGQDLKQYLHLTNSRIFDLIKLSPRSFFLPSVTVFPSNLCNYDCVMCSNRKSCNNHKEEMDFSSIQKIIEECSKIVFKPLIHFSGYGEPLVYSRMKDTFELCTSARMKWSLTTNAYLLDEYMKYIISDNCYAINISIHGNPAQNDRITGITGSFDVVHDNILNLEKIKKQNNQDNPFVALNCVITDINITHLMEIYETFSHLPVNSVTFQHLHFSVDELYGNNYPIEKSKLPRLVDFLAFIENGDLPKKTYSYPIIKKEDVIGYYTDQNHFSTNSCLYPWLSVEVYPNGDVRICNQVIGNIHNESLRSIINCDAAISFRNWVRHGKKGILESPPNCFKCTHRHYS